MTALTLRSTGLGSGIDKDRPDYIVYCGGWAVGLATLGVAKAEFQKSWDAWRFAFEGRPKTICSF